jgi:hypothetical protein
MTASSPASRDERRADRQDVRAPAAGRARPAAGTRRVRRPGAYRSKDGGPEVMTTRRSSGSTRKKIECRMATGKDPRLVQGPQASHVKSPRRRTSYAPRVRLITPVVGADFVTSRAFCDASLSSHAGVVGGALIVTLGCVGRPVALSCPLTRSSMRTNAAAMPPATKKVASSRRLRPMPEV